MSISFFERLSVFSSFKDSSITSNFFIDLDIVWLFVSVPPNQRFDTYGILQSMPAFLTSLFTETFVPTNNIVPDCEAIV